ncbi:hypothetical protein RJ639_041565, partial [Escallonia herrerae]
CPHLLHRESSRSVYTIQAFSIPLKIFLKHPYMHEKEMCIPRLIVAAVALIGTLASGAAFLPAEEVEALNRSAIALGKTDWDFSVNPCSTDQNSTWVISEKENAVTCNCTFNNDSVCH